MNIPQDGSFKFNVEILKTGLYLLKIGKVNTHIFIEPGDQYTVVIGEPLEEDLYGPAKEVFVQAEIFESDSRLNYHITQLEKQLNNFFIEATTETYNLRSGGGIKSLADSFLLVVKKEFSDIDSKFFSSYLHFRLAEFELATRHSRSLVFDKYFKDHQPAFELLSFANAFKMFYAGYMSPKSVHPFSDALETALSNQQFKPAIDELSTNKYLENPLYRELVFTSEIYELGRKKIYPMSVVINLLDSIIDFTKSPEICLQAKNSQKILLKLAPGTRAPDFIFADIIGNLYRISEYEGRYIYIQFFDKFDSETLREMSLMKVLKEGYGADIAMFSFSTTEPLRDLLDVPAKHDFDWFFGKIGHPAKVSSDYDLRAFPQYFFLDEKLNIVSYPCPPPGSRIERIFARIWNEKHPNKQLHFKLQPPEVIEEEIGEIQEK
jgi:hypothetical protein